MFSRCKILSNLNLSSFNTNKITNMNEMFDFCTNLAIKKNKININLIIN